MNKERVVALAVDADLDAGLLSEYGTATRVMQLLGSWVGLDIIIKLHVTLRASHQGLIQTIKDRGFPVFVDFKLHDIPSTMIKDAKWLSKALPDYVTVHCSAGLDVMRALRDKLPPEVKVIGVTILSSMSDRDCTAIYGLPVREMVNRFSRMAHEAGLDGVTAPSTCIHPLRYADYYQGLIVAPGCEPKTVSVPIDIDDQVTRITAAKAVEHGANIVVMGRPITQAPDPRQMIESTLAEMLATARA